MARYLADDLSEEERTSFETTLSTDENVSREFEAYMNIKEPSLGVKILKRRLTVQ